jgi:hypothetical protein
LTLRLGLLLLLLVALGSGACDSPRSPQSYALGDGGLPAGRPCRNDVDCRSGHCLEGSCGVPDLAVPADGGVDVRDGGPGVDVHDGGPVAVDAHPSADGASPADLGDHPDAGPGAIPCTYDTDCPLPFLCGHAGHCVPQCVEDRDCRLAVGEVCQRGGCRAPGGPCLEQAECLPGELCRLRRCEPEPQCVRSAECPDGQVCLDGRCTTLEEPADAGVPVEDAGSSTCAPRPGEYRDECHCAGQCQTGLCLDTGIVGRGGSCTFHCGAAAPCPDLDLCLLLGDGTSVCVANDVGFSCRGAFECLFACLTDPATGSSACTAPCASGADCPQGWGCGRLLTDLGVQQLCLPAGARCLGGADCAGGRCLPRQAGDALGFCTLDCRDARDCPGGWACCAVFDGVDFVRVCYDGPVCPY